jgi:branched-chain amino acid transport system substrate-binding protein
MKKLLVMVFVLGFCLAVVLPNSLSWAGNPDKVKIGAIGPFTGPLARYGILSLKNPVTLAVEEINEKGGINGIPIEMIFEDDEVDPSKTVIAARKLIYKDKVPLIIGTPTSGTSIAALKVLTEAEIPLFDPENVSPAVASVGKRWVFNGGFMPEDETVTLLMVTMEKYKNYGFLSDNSGYGLTTREYFVAKAEEMGRPFALVETAERRAVDLTPHMLKFKEKGCDAVVVMGYAPAMATAAKAAKAIDYHPQFLFGFGACLTELLEVGGDAVEGCIYTDMFDPERPGVPEYLDRLEKRFGKDAREIQGPGSAAYSMTYLVAEGLEAVGVEGDQKEVARRVRDWTEQNVREWDKHLLAGKNGSKWTFTRFKRNGPSMDFVTLWTVGRDESGNLVRKRLHFEGE